MGIAFDSHRRAGSPLSLKIASHDVHHIEKLSPCQPFSENSFSRLYRFIVHNLLMVGPPGAGKSMLAQRLPGILPPLSPAEALGIR